MAFALSQIVQYAGLTFDNEVKCIPGENVRPADVYIFNGPDGIPLAIDVTIVSALSSLAVTPAHDLSDPAVNVNAAERLKVNKYEIHLKELKGRVDFSPFGISSFGATGRHAKAVVRFLVQRIHKTRLIPCEIAHYYVLRVLIGKVFQEIGLAMSQDLVMV